MRVSGILVIKDFQFVQVSELSWGWNSRCLPFKKRQVANQEKEKPAVITACRWFTAACCYHCCLLVKMCKIGAEIQHTSLTCHWVHFRGNKYSSCLIKMGPFPLLYPCTHLFSVCLQFYLNNAGSMFKFERERLIYLPLNIYFSKCTGNTSFFLAI